MTKFINAPNKGEIELVKPQTWSSFIDDSFGNAGSKVGVLLVSPEGHKLNCGMIFRFEASNSVSKFEPHLASLLLARKMQVKMLLINIDSQLIAKQVNGNFITRDKSRAAYLKRVINLLTSRKCP